MNPTPINPPLEILWTVNRTAEYLGIRPGTVYNWINVGKIKYVKMGARVRIPKSEIVRIAGNIQIKLGK